VFPAEARGLRQDHLMRALAIVVALLTGGSLVVARQTPVSPAESLASRVQTHYAGVHDFTADFVLSTTSPLTPRPLVERGTLRVKKPGRMRWTFHTDDKREFVADGSQIYSYFPKDKYFMRSDMPKDSEASTALLFLSGRGHLVRDFTPTLASGAQAGESRLELRPRTRQADFERLTLDVASDTLAFRGLVVHDLQGGQSTYRFSKLRENVGLTDAEFVFTIPKGVVMR
jgi:outer membrane lipoprotein carrier protein